jgi:hypothetical protein
MSDSLPPAVQKLDQVGLHRLVRIACGMSLLATALMVWSVLDPTPVPVMLSMSIGQVIGTLSLLAYVSAVVVHEARRRSRSHTPKNAPASAAKQP